MLDASLLKTGACSIVLGPDYYREYFPYQKNKLLKVSYLCARHNETGILPRIRKIPDYQKYYSIVEETSYLIQRGDTFYRHLQEIVDNMNQSFWGNYLYVFYINYVGNYDLLDTLQIHIDKHQYTYWTSFQKIIDFIKQILQATQFLHNIQICHLDIKPENIIVDTQKQRFRLIDFGFACTYPFDNFVSDIRGTPDYFPIPSDDQNNNMWLPRVKTNDLIPYQGSFPMVRDRMLVYKVDSFCLGRVILMTLNIFLSRKKIGCRKDKKHRKINKIIQKLTLEDVYRRQTVRRVLDDFF